MHIILAAFIEEFLVAARSLGWLKYGAIRRDSVRPSVPGQAAGRAGDVHQVVVEPPPDSVPPGDYDRKWIGERTQVGLSTFTGEVKVPGQALPRGGHGQQQGQGRLDKKGVCGGASGSSEWDASWQQDSDTDLSPGEYVTFTRNGTDTDFEGHASEEYEDPEPVESECAAANVHGTPGANMGCCGQKKLLMITTSVCASASFAFLCIAVATDYWLFADELKQRADGTNYHEETHTGLWRKCTINVSLPPNCSYISYFTDVEMDELGPVQSILASMRRSTIFPLISLLILLIGEIVCFVGHCHHKKKVLTFVAGILFVIGGLCTLIGIILFIGAITGEVGNKPKNTMDEPKFQYWYGSSFMLTVGSFVVSELTGVLSVYLYISRHKHAYRKKQERLTMVDTNERQPHGSRYRRPRSQDRSRDQSRDNSPSHSDTYYTYTPVSDSSKEMSNYTIPREVSRHTVSTSAETHLSKEHSLHSVRDLDTYARRTTPV